MKNTCLWINGVKVHDVKGITDNFNISDVRGYFLGGSLIPWVESRSEYGIAKALKNIPANENPDKYLFDIFNNNYVKPDYHKGVPNKQQNDVIFSHGSFIPYSSSTGRFSLGSYISPFGSYKYKFEFERGSYLTESFTKYFTSFNFGSFTFNSFNLSSFTIGSSFSLSSMFGSFNYVDFFENKKSCCVAPILTNLSSEPLNSVGYGIHII